MADKNLKISVEINKAEFECNVCFEVPKFSPIFQCHDGHIFCNDCHPKLRQCPVCRKGTLGYIKSLIAQKILQTPTGSKCNENPLAFLRYQEDFQRMKRSFLEQLRQNSDYDLLPVFLEVLEHIKVTDPELFELISQNNDAFTQIINEPMDTDFVSEDEDESEDENEEGNEDEEENWDENETDEVNCGFIKFLKWCFRNRMSRTLYL